MEFTSGLQRTGPLNVEEVRRKAQQEGFTAFVFPAQGIVDRTSFFDAVRTTFPLDPPLIGSHSWDALSDSLWEGLFMHPAVRIVILWPGTHAMAVSASSDFATALNVLADVATLLADPKATRGRAKEVAILAE